MLGDLGYRYGVLLEQTEGASGGEQLYAVLGQAAGEVDDAGLVGDADQGAANRGGGGLGHGDTLLTSGAMDG